MGDKPLAYEFLWGAKELVVSLLATSSPAELSVDFGFLAKVQTAESEWEHRC